MDIYVVVRLTNNKGLTGSNLTPRKIVDENVHEGGENVIKENDNMLEGGSDIPSEGQIIPYQQINRFDEDVIEFDSQVIHGRPEESNLMTG